MKAKFAYFDNDDCRYDTIFCLTITEHSDIQLILDDLSQGVKGRFEYLYTVKDETDKPSKLKTVKAKNKRS